MLKLKTLAADRAFFDFWKSETLTDNRDGKKCSTVGAMC